MNMNSAEKSNTNAVFRLIALQGPERGKKIDLGKGRQYIMGRGEDCDIRIDMADKTVSRRHARIEATEKQIVIENLSAANPLLVKGKPIQKVVLNDKGQFRIGESLFTVKKTGTTATALGKPADKNSPVLRIALVAALAILCIVFIFAITKGDKESDVVESDTTKPLSDALPTRPAKFPERDVNAGGLSKIGLAVSAEDMKKADEHFRQGMFFYDTGNLGRAVDEWNRAVILYPDHPDAQTWFLRAEKELAEKVKKHYQNAMLHYKYMRYDDAAQEFRLVIELSRDKTSDQYINALKLLNEIEGR